MMMDSKAAIKIFNHIHFCANPFFFFTFLLIVFMLLQHNLKFFSQVPFNWTELPTGLDAN